MPKKMEDMRKAIQKKGKSKDSAYAIAKAKSGKPKKMKGKK